MKDLIRYIQETFGDAHIDEAFKLNKAAHLPTPDEIVKSFTGFYDFRIESCYTNNSGNMLKQQVKIKDLITAPHNKIKEKYPDVYPGNKATDYADQYVFMYIIGSVIYNETNKGSSTKKFQELIADALNSSEITYKNWEPWKAEGGPHSVICVRSVSQTDNNTYFTIEAWKVE